MRLAPRRHTPDLHPGLCGTCRGTGNSPEAGICVICGGTGACA